MKRSRARRCELRWDRGGVQSAAAVGGASVDSPHLPDAVQTTGTLVPKKSGNKVRLVHAERSDVHEAGKGEWPADVAASWRC